MGREEQLLAASIGRTLAEARVAERALIREREKTGWQEPSGPDEHFFEDADAALASYLRKAFRDVGILAERLNLPIFREEIDKELAECKKRGFSIVIPDDFYFHSPTLDRITALFESLSTMTDSGAITGLETFQTIIKSTAKIIEDRKLTPKKEKDVRDAVFEILGYAFTDLVREPVLSHPMKIYKPDFGVQSLMALAEYKYVASKTELKRVIDELYADMRGYSGHVDWRNFFALIYMNGPFAIQEEVDAKFVSTSADPAWKVMVVNGSGDRPSK